MKKLGKEQGWQRCRPFLVKNFVASIKEKRISPIYIIEKSANLHGGVCRLVIAYNYWSNNKEVGRDGFSGKEQYAG